MEQLNDLRKKDPPLLSGEDYLHIVLAGMTIPRERFNERIERLVDDYAGRRTEGEPLPRLMILGGSCDVPEFIGFIESKGANVVADGLCFGMRYYQGLVTNGNQNPISAIAERYVSRSACPSVMNSFENSYAETRRIIDEWKINGVVCARLKFCDHWAGFRKLLTDALAKDGIPVLDLEREYTTAGSGQISTRVQAFLEMMQH
jgi:benzoyl-CoA reductase/2-hydroxyglutaryl-CoA dehydratase subunit BcrC/BadD/HgdB